MKKGDRVKFKYSNKDYFGVVIKGTTKGRFGKVKIRTDEGPIFTGSAFAIQLCDKPLPAHGKNAIVKHKKGDNVSFTFEGTDHIGVVLKGGSNKIVVGIYHNGEELSIKGHARGFKPVNREAFKDDPSAMDGYSLSGYKEVESMSEDTACFTATIKTPKGKKIRVSNEGRGGPDFFDGDRKAIDQLFADAKAWARQNGSPFSSLSEDASLWIKWYEFRRPYHVSAKADFAAITKEMAA